MDTSNGSHTMLLLIFFLALIMVVFLWVGLVPFYITVNSARSHYEISQPGVFQILLCPGVTPWIKVRVIGINIPVSSRFERNGSSSSRKRSQSRKSLRAWRFLTEGVVKSFRINRFTLIVDSGNVLFNAWLFPLFYSTSHGSVLLRINFVGQNYMEMEAEGRLYKMLWTGIVFLTKK